MTQRGLWMRLTVSAFSWLSDLHTGRVRARPFASFCGIFAIPPLYVFLRAIRERLRPGAQSWKVRRQSKFSEGRF